MGRGAGNVSTEAEQGRVGCRAPARWIDSFRVSGASIPGREHLRLGRNNQDGLALHVEDDLMVGAVTDGCSAAPESEVGARLGAAWLVSRAPSIWREDRANFPVALGSALGDYLERTVMEITVAGRPLEDALGRFFLFGFLLLVLDPEETVVVGAGDGAHAINGCAVWLEPGEGNAPDYPAYSLLPRDRAAPGPGPGGVKVHRRVPTAQVASVMIATDGAEPLLSPGLAVDHGFDPLFTPGGRLAFPDKPRALQKRLNVLGSRRGLLADDTTLLHVERREGP